MGSTKVRIVCISDTHNAAPGEGYTLPKGDILIHAGDLTNQGSYSELKKALTWLEKADFPVKVVIAGNHDLSLDPNYGLKHEEGWTVQPKNVDECRKLLSTSRSVTYLQHSSAVIALPGKDITLRVFGSPYSPDRSRQNWAFQYPDADGRDLWEAVPVDTDVLVTHTPPLGHCDASEHWREGGCQALTEALRRVRPLLHICGHYHEGRSAKVLCWGSAQSTADDVRIWNDPGAGNKKQSLFDLTGARGGTALDAGRETAIVNASIMAKSFGRGGKAFNKPIVIDLDLPIRREGQVDSADAPASAACTASTSG
ncbi:hypothetical protein LTR85_004120 [Meristemomyces frigidus]|nr:hypothetical protein LTR85_004120 [Meristemomyces frigidus]